MMFGERSDTFNPRIRIKLSANMRKEVIWVLNVPGGKMSGYKKKKKKSKEFILEIFLFKKTKQNILKLLLWQSYLWV